jgi:hypothetical protein
MAVSCEVPKEHRLIKVAGPYSATVGCVLGLVYVGTNWAWECKLL